MEKKFKLGPLKKRGKKEKASGEKPSIKLARFIIEKQNWIVSVFIAACIFCAVAMLFVEVNYDLTEYLPDTAQSGIGLNKMEDEFGYPGTARIMLKDVTLYEAKQYKDRMEDVDGVDQILWCDSTVNIYSGEDFIHKEDIEDYYKDGYAVMDVTFKEGNTAKSTSAAIDELKAIAGDKGCFTGMAVQNKSLQENLASEMQLILTVAIIMIFTILCITTTAWSEPFLFLLVMGVAILLNRGTNIFIGRVSFLTNNVAMVLQLATSMDYSIFLLNSYEENKKRFEGDKERAMAHAINATFKSVIGSSITTVAGFIALCFMTFSLGRDMGIVMAKGVVIGVFCCVTLLPALVLTFDKAIEKTTHKPLLPSFDKASAFITKHYKIWLIIFLVMLFPAIHGNNNLKNYYNIDKSLPATLDSNVANAKLQETFDMNNVHMVLLKKGLTSKEKTEMLNQIKDVDGVKWALGMDSFVGAAFPDTMIPNDLKKMLESDEYEMEFICSQYKTATDEVNNQIDEIQKIVKSYSPESMVIGEAPLTKDLQDVTDVDLKTVNTISILAIFIIIMVVFKSISLPFILVAVIEFAIFVNMSVPYYQGKEVVFVASIVIGCIQLGATVDYAILMTSRYQKERGLGKNKKEAIAIAHKTSMKSIVISGCSFFAATFGVGLYTQVDMIGSITNLLSRGAVISTLVVLFILPAMFMIFDSLICHTSIGFAKKKNAEEKK